MKNIARQVWVASNGWRKRYWLSRVLILVVIVSFHFYDAPILPRLVRIACNAILYSAEPEMQNAIYRSNKANATRRLQAALRAKVHVDGDGLLSGDEHEVARAIGADPAQLELPPLRADLEQLVAAAQHADLVAPSYTARAVRKDAWRLASIEAEEIMAPQRAQIEELMGWYSLPDLTSASTWGNGASEFLFILRQRLFHTIGNPSHWVPFLVVGYLATALLSMSLHGRHRLAAGAGALTAWAAVLIVPRLVRHGCGSLVVFLPSCAVHWPWIIGPFLLILAVTIAGARRGKRFLAEGIGTAKPLIALGLVLAVWGLAPALKAPLWLGPNMCLLIDWPILFEANISHGVRVGLVIAGAVALGAAIGPALVKKMRGRSRTVADES